MIAESTWTAIKSNRASHPEGSDLLGTKGKNITRFFRSPERRLFSTVQELGTSLLAVHDLLILRVSDNNKCGGLLRI